MDILKNKWVTGAVGVAAVLFLVYYLWTSAGSSALLTTTEGTSPLSQEILTTLGKLHTIKLDINSNHIFTRTLLRPSGPRLPRAGPFW